jgi:glycosyltransferase involved in cell wall biosynthesis
MKVLALEPYYGGSHRAFLDSWSEQSAHSWTTMGLPPYKWKWRMRHGALTLARRVAQLINDEAQWDLLFASDMLDLAQFLGLAHPSLRSLPSVVYFHENQLTYPVRVEKEHDLHFAMTNFSTAVASDTIWFNSAFHRDSFLEALPAFFKRMPDFYPDDDIAALRAKSSIHPPGVSTLRKARSPRPAGPVRILWAARWEHDKAPETFFAALRALEGRGVDFRLSVLGESFREQPSVFEDARARFAARIDHWGFLPAREDYEAVLNEADLFVSTARHEFFGISAVEAVAAGAFPVLPYRLSYPEVMRPLANAVGGEIFYEGGVRPLARKLAELSARAARDTLWPNSDRDLGRRLMERYHWSRLGPELDDALERARLTR